MAQLAFNNNLVGFRTILGDFSRAYMFRVDLPTWLENNDTLSMLVRSVTLPASKIKTTPISFQGLKINVATVADFDPTWTIECLADESQVLRGNLLRWMSYIYDAGTMEAAVLTSYKKDKVTVKQLDRLGNTTMVYTFYGLFPSQVDSPKMGHEDVEPQKFNVTFTYDFFTVSAGKVTGADVDADNTKTAVDASERIDPSNEVNKAEPTQATFSKPADLGGINVG